MSEGEKYIMMQTLLELKWKGSKKHRSEHHLGKLHVKTTPFKYARFAEAIEARSGSLPPLANAFAIDVEPHAHERPLLQVHCPKCDSQRTSKGLKLQRVTNSSNLKCQLCSVVSNTKDWACSCVLKWRKCPRHTMVEAPGRATPSGTNPLTCEDPTHHHRSRDGSSRTMSS